MPNPLQAVTYVIYGMPSLKSCAGSLTCTVTQDLGFTSHLIYYLYFYMVSNATCTLYNTGPNECISRGL